MVRDPEDETCLSLLFANQTEDDILLRKELEAVQTEHPDRFKLWYTVDRPGEGWQYSSGFVSAEIIQKALFPPSGDNLVSIQQTLPEHNSNFSSRVSNKVLLSALQVLMCGPPPMINFACTPNLDKLGYSQSNRFSY